MDRLVPVLILIALFALILLGMYAGWRRRGRSQLPQLPAPDHASTIADLGEEVQIGPVDAVYVSTVFADQPLERVVAHGLGSRSPARVELGTGGSWRLERTGAPSLTIPAPTVEFVSSAGGMAGKFIGGDGLLVIRWQLGDQLLDTGLRLAQRSDHDLLLSRKEHS